MCKSREDEGQFCKAKPEKSRNIFYTLLCATSRKQNTSRINGCNLRVYQQVLAKRFTRNTVMRVSLICLSVVMGVWFSLGFSNVSPTRKTAITKTRQISEGPDCRVVLRAW